MKTPLLAQAKRIIPALAVLFLSLTPTNIFPAGAYRYQMPEKDSKAVPSAHTVIGTFRDYVIKERDTLLDIARQFDLGYVELTLLYPAINPWLPPAGKRILIPTAWVLPIHRKGGIVINVPELRLYLFLDRINMVKTYPIGIGVQDWPTPFGRFRVVEKTKNPTWHIPPGLHEKYGRKSIPPGPNNPLGKYWLRLSNHNYGIHGTNMPWGIGRLVSHGCIRLYPEDIKALFSWVQIGTPVDIIYEPIKIGFTKGRLFVEVHPDMYHKIPDLLAYTQQKLFDYDVWQDVDLEGLVQAVEKQEGIPVDITQKKKGR